MKSLIKSKSIKIFFVVLSVSLLFFLMARYSVSNYDALRPFHRAALIFSGLSFFLMKCHIRPLLNSSLLKNYLYLIGLILVIGAIGGYRSFVDSIYIAFINTLILWVSLLLLSLKDRKFVFEVFLNTLTAFNFIFMTLAFTSWFFMHDSNLAAFILGHDLKYLMPFLQSESYLIRWHGIFGTPTALGMFCAFSAFIAIFLKGETSEKLSISRRSTVSLYFLIIIALIGLIGSGSRTGIVAFFLMVIIGRSHLRIFDILKYFVISLVIYFSAFHCWLEYKGFEGLVASDKKLEKVVNEIAFYSNESVRINMTASNINSRLSSQSSQSSQSSDWRSSNIKPMILGCGVDCALKTRTSSRIGYIDLVKNYGLPFFGLFLLLVLRLIAAIIMRKIKAQESQFLLALLTGCLIAEITGSWIFSSFFNVVQIAFFFVVAKVVALNICGENRVELK